MAGWRPRPSWGRSSSLCVPAISCWAASSAAMTASRCPACKSSTSAAAAGSAGAWVRSSPMLTRRENHQGTTRLGPGVAPLAQVSVGVGNGDGTEGAFAGRILGTYLHGPVLVRNPGLADLLLAWAVGQLPPLRPEDEALTQALREQRLAAVPTAAAGQVSTPAPGSHRR